MTNNSSTKCPSVHVEFVAVLNVLRTNCPSVHAEFVAVLNVPVRPFNYVRRTFG